MSIGLRVLHGEVGRERRDEESTGRLRISIGEICKKFAFFPFVARVWVISGKYHTQGKRSFEMEASHFSGTLFCWL